MIFTNIEIINMFGIDNAEIELTYPRKTSTSPVEQYLQKFNNINYKKIGIILGANASGKTSIAKSMCVIQNILCGRTIEMNKGFFKNIKFVDNKEFGFIVEFIIEDHIYKSKMIFLKDELFIEEWSRVKITTSDSIATLRAKLEDSASNIYSYYHPSYKSKNLEDLAQFIFDVKSAFLSSTDNNGITDIIKDNQVFSYRYSSESNPVLMNKVDLDFFSNILKTFDPSVEKVSRSKDDKESLVIHLAKGKKQTIDAFGEVNKDSLLSSGTIEAIKLAQVLFSIKNSPYGIFFIDEQLAYSHTILEKTIIDIILSWIDKKDMQVFFTTHNTDLLDIGIPSYNYFFTRKNSKNHSIEIIHPENEVIHKGRSLKGIVEKDILSLTPNIDKLLEVLD